MVQRPTAPAAAGVTYAVTPDRVAYSAGPDRLSVVQLIFVATNTLDTPADINRLDVTVPHGISSAEDALVTSANAPLTATVAGSATPWAVLSHGDGRWTAMPLPPATGLAAKETITFTLSNVVVNDVAGTAYLKIVENADPARRATAGVTKFEPSGPGQDAPRITHFAAEPAAVALGGETALAWTVTGAASAVLQPGAIPLPHPASGTVRLPVYETTLFTLQVAGPGGTDSKVATVVVKPVQIETFTAHPAEVSPGDAVTLSVRTEFAASASIDQGVGPVPRMGEVTVHPRQTTLYTLTANGQSPQTKAVLVTVTEAS